MIKVTGAAAVLFGSLLGLAACGNLEGYQQTAGMPSGGGNIGPQQGETGSSSGAFGMKGSVGLGRGQTGGVPGVTGSAPGFSANGKLFQY